MSSYKFFVILFTLSSSCFVQSENEEEYMIEVIIFEQLEIVGDERLKPKNLNLNDINTIALLDKPQIKLNEKIILQSFNYEDDELFLENLIIDQIIDEQNKQSDPPVLLKTIDKNKWYQRQQTLNKLDNIYRRLDRRKEYRILHKQSWLQPALGKNDSPFVHELFGNNGFLIKLYKSRYLHLDVIAYLEGNLRTDKNTDLIDEIKFDALQRSIPDDVINREIEINSKIINSGEIFKTDPEIIETKTDLPLSIKVGEVKYLLNEERRIFKNESHYFDHPKIGVIISVYDSSL